MATASAAMSTSSATAINPTVGILARPDTRIDLSYEYFHDRRTADRGVPSHGGEPRRRLRPRPSSAIPDDSFAQGRRPHRDAWRSSTTSARPDAAQPHALRRLRQILPEHLPDGAVLAASATCRAVALGAYNNRNDRRNLFSQTDLVWENRLGGIDQTLLVGFEIGRQKSRNRARAAPSRAPAGIIDGRR